MSYLNPTILFGLAFATIPLILHLLLKQKPKRLIFPALQLIAERRKQSVRRLRLRHFWLLLLRTLVFALIVWALARPSMPPANYSLTTRELVTLFVVIAIGLISYQVMLRKWRQLGMSRAVYQERRSRWRGWLTGGTLAVLLLLVGWPYQQRIRSEISDPAPIRTVDVPVAGVLLFDTSLSMEYLHEGQSRLEAAREMAISHLETLPTGSRVAIANTSSDAPILFQPTMAAARARLDALELNGVALPLEDRVRDAVEALEEDRRRILEEAGVAETETGRDRYVRRVYVFTDLSASAWRQGGVRLLRNDLERFEAANVYVLDVGQLDPQDRAVTDVILSRERIPVGGDLIVSAVVGMVGHEPGPQIVELHTLDADGRPVKYGQMEVQLESGTPTRIEFPAISDVLGPLVQGAVRLASSDPLAFDDVRYFTAEVGPAPEVLVLAPTEKQATEWMTALAPYGGFELTKNRFAVDWMPPSQLRDADVSSYACICLIDVPALPDAEWSRLGTYVERGGGLIVVLGNTAIDSPSYNRPSAQVFLPGVLDAWQPEADWRLRIDDRAHPMFWKFRQYENYGAFSILEEDVWVSRFWRVDPANNANVLATFTDPVGSPALLERTHGSGRTVMFTTAVHRPDNYRQHWTNLPSPLLSPWLFVAFAEQMTEYVSRFTDREHNFTAGRTPVITIPAAQEDRQMLLRKPGLTQSRVEVAASETQVRLESVTESGHYELATSASSSPLAGFSLNPSGSEADLTRLTEQQLDDVLGEDRYQLARTTEELQQQIDTTDLGQEVFPVLLLLLVVAFCGEHLIANRFYDSDVVSEWQAPPQNPPAEPSSAPATPSRTS